MNINFEKKTIALTKSEMTNASKYGSQMQSYFERRQSLFKENYIAALERSIPPVSARKVAWKQTYSDLWAEFGCCFYYCEGLVLAAYSEEYSLILRDIYELCRKLADAVPPLPEVGTESLQSYQDYNF